MKFVWFLAFSLYAGSAFLPSWAPAAESSSGEGSGKDPFHLFGKPVVGKNADGHLEVFKVDSDGQVRRRWQKASNGDWSSWSSLGGSFLPGIVVGTNSDGRLELFAIEQTSHGLSHCHQLRTNSTEWSGWASLNGKLQAPLTLGQNPNGRLEVFAVALTGGHVQHIWQKDEIESKTARAETAAEESWSDWVDMGGDAEPGLAVVRNRDGRLELFGVRAGRYTLAHCWQLATDDPQHWSAWTELGGAISPGFAVGQNILGRLEVFAVNRTNSALQRIYQIAPGESARWSEWEDFGGSQAIGPPAGLPAPEGAASAMVELPGGAADLEHPEVTAVKPGVAVGHSADGRIEVFAVTAGNSELLHRWERLVNGSDNWSRWAGMGITAEPYPAIVRNEDGDLEVFVVDTHDPATINHRRQISQARDWLDWASLDQPTFQYSSRTWQTDEGLPHDIVQALAQTLDGYVWVGTQAGLTRFDGLVFSLFSPKSAPELKGAIISALCADREGALWIGTEGNGLYRWSGGALKHFTKKDGLAGDHIGVIYQSKDGALWIGTTTGMSRLQNGKFTLFTKAQGLSSDVVRAIHEDRRGNLWVATGAGLNRLGTDGMAAFAMPNGLPNDSVRCICQDRGGRVWIGSNNGMLWYSWFWKIFYAYNTRFGLSDTFVSAICEDREGNLWVGTYSGLNRFHEGRFFSQLDNEGVSFGRINTMLEDREGNLWVGSQDGLVRLTPKHFFAVTRRQGLTHNNITSVLEDHTGNLWIGTWGGGLNRMKDERVTGFGANTNAATNALSQALILSLCEGRDGSLWAGADFDGGLAHLKDGKLTYSTGKDKLIASGIRVIHEDHVGNLWLGTSRGLSRLKNGKLTTYTSKDNLAGDVIRAICEDHAGDLWVGTDSGLSHWNRSTEAFTSLTTEDGLSDAVITTLYEDKEHTLWIGTASGGLNRMPLGKNSDRADRLSHPSNFPAFWVYTTRDGLFSNEILDILEDDYGWLWISCSRGVFRVPKRDLDERQMVTSLVYGKSDGFESTQCNGIGKPSSWKSQDGRLWFATSKGLVGVDPARLPVNALPPPVYIEKVLADRKQVGGETGEWDGWDRSQMETGAEALPLKISPGRGEMEFDYTALNYQAPESTQFKYKLEGADSAWIEAGTRRVAHYNNLEPGTYRFQVIACNKDGIWNEQGAALTILLKPHVWQTWWWRSSVALLVIGAASGTARYVTRKRMQRRLEIAEQRHAIEKERGRIAQDIHDDLGSSLTRIMMLGERAEDGLEKREDVGVHVQKIVRSARHTVQALDEIVWAVNPENDTLEGLVEYISHYADELFENTTLSCRLEMPVELPALSLSAETRHDLFLVVKEALNNVVKHAQATEVRVSAAVSGTVLEIVIEDNGSGFDPEVTGNGRRGNGLGNMRKRIENQGGTLTLTSTAGKGTRIQIQTILSPERTVGK